MKKLLSLPFLCLTLFCAPCLLHAKLVEKTVQRLGGTGELQFLSLIEIKNFQALIKLKLLPPSLLFEAYPPSCFKKNPCLLDFLIHRSLLNKLPEMKRLPEVSDQEIESALKKIRGKISRKAFLKKLKHAGWSLSSFKKELAIDLQNNYFLQSFFSTSSLSPSDFDLLSHDSSIFNIFEYEFVSLSFSSNQKKAVLRALRKKQTEESLEDFATNLGLKTKAFKLMEHELGNEFKHALKKLSISKTSPLLYIDGVYYLLQLKWKRGFASDQEKKLQLEAVLFNQKRRIALARWMRQKRASMFLQ